MVIFDSTNNFNDQIKGMLHINLIDVDYLVKKYGLEKLKEMISADYVDAFESELEQFKDADLYSNQYYCALSLGIENEEDARLLELIKKEVEAGALYTKSQLTTITKYNSDYEVDEICKLCSFDDNLTDHHNYITRSLKMVSFITESIDLANELVDTMYEADALGNSGKKARAFKDYDLVIKNLKSMGLSGQIVESDYFDEAIEKSGIIEIYNLINSNKFAQRFDSTLVDVYYKAKNNPSEELQFVKKEVNLLDEDVEDCGIVVGDGFAIEKSNLFNVQEIYKYKDSEVEIVTELDGKPVIYWMVDDIIIDCVEGVFDQESLERLVKIVNKFAAILGVEKGMNLNKSRAVEEHPVQN